MKYLTTDYADYTDYETSIKICLQNNPRNLRNLWLKYACGTLLLLATAARAEVREVLAEVSNPQPFVGEAFVFTLKVVVAAGSDLEGENIYGLNDYPFAPGTLRRTGRARDAAGNEVVSYAGVFRATAPFASRVELQFGAQSVTQQRNGFFTQWVRRPVRVAARPFDFSAQALPEAGRPENFSGAIGTFTLTVESSTREVRVNDLVTRVVHLKGAENNLFGNGVPEFPDLGGNFKVYAPNEISRVENPPEVVLSQVVIPLNTNAVEIAAPVFTFFDPKAGMYRRVEPPAERLVFIDGEVEAQEDVRVLTNAAESAKNGALDFSLSLRRAGEQVEVTRQTQARLAPSQRAAVLFEIEPGSHAVVAERAEGWLRVESRGRVGWIREEL